MPQRDIIFVDVNSIWHRRIASALAERCRALSLSVQPALDALVIETIRLPRGWASVTAPLAQRLLARFIMRLGKKLRDPLVILTSPAYEPLSRYLYGRLPILTYIADDYGSYDGWRAALSRQRAMQSRAQLNVFVSDALRQRAIEQHGVPWRRTFVSPNATEPRFVSSSNDAIPTSLKQLPRPIVGVLGGLSSRLDLSFLESIASLPSVGTFLVAGPLGTDIDASHPLIKNPKTFVTGRLPHEDMHLYAGAMDAGIIPYAPSDLNHYCSPMRLFDHLASGARIFALPTCEQVRSIAAEGLFVGSAPDVLGELSNFPDQPARIHRDMPILWKDRASALLKATANLIGDAN